MWIPESWTTEADVEKDIVSLAEHFIPTKKDLDPTVNKTPNTILQYRQRMSKNQSRPLNSDIDDTATYVVSGRGRGIRDRVIHPGGSFESHPSDDVQLKRQIREVAGMGYSNGVIEQSIKCKSYEGDVDTSMYKMVPTSSVSGKGTGSTNSSKSSAESSPSTSKKWNSINHDSFKVKTEEFPALK